MAAKKRRKSKPAPSEKPRAQPSRLVRAMGLGALFFAAALSAVFFLYYPETPGPGVGNVVHLSFTGRESTSEILRRLDEEGLVQNKQLFALYFRARGGSVAPGPHIIRDDVSPRELIARLERRGSTAKITFPEGFTSFDMSRRLDKNFVCDAPAFIAATREPSLLKELDINGDSAEGFLFPATYDLPQDSDPKDVVRAMVKAFDKHWSNLEKAHARTLHDLQGNLGWERRQVVTLASMIEKEAAVDEERAIIASVFMNRLRDPKFTPRLLQCDPTAAYGCVAGATGSDACVAFLKDTTKITHDLLADEKNPYNTYKHEGLPPGPIANPGAKSLEAALEPSDTRYLYFVAKGGGRHTFSETYAEHQTAIKP